MTGLDELERAARAAEAERSVRALFGTRLRNVPLTHLGRPSHPTRPAPSDPLDQPWHYWWQAHYLDALVDAGRRELESGNRRGARDRAWLADRLLATIWLRAGRRITNDFYDDMAWLALAVDRLRVLHVALGGWSRRPLPDLAVRTLTTALRSAVTDELGGGAFWDTRRDFKNVPATAPIALHLARRGDTTTAHALVDWVWTWLRDGDTGLVLDGVRVVGADVVVRDVYSYNQGTVLGALLAIGDQESLARAGDLVQAVAEGLTVSAGPASHLRPLATHGSGDGGLFTGILVRYLALAAVSPVLGQRSRLTASRLVLDTADATYAGRAARVMPDSQRVTVYPVDLADPASTASAPTDAPVELSAQLQAWTVLEAAWRVSTRIP